MDAPQIKIYQPSEPRPSYNAIVALGTTASIGLGVPTFLASASLGTVAVGTDGQGTTSQNFTGISKSVSTEVTATAGSVTLWLPLPGMIYMATAKTASDFNTAATVNAHVGRRVVFDLTATGGVWTIDTAASDSATNAIVIIGGDPLTSEVHFVYKATCSVLGQIA